jgi:alginate O-acetyltransferase complex protein AlgI
VTWVFFRAATLDQTWDYLRSMAGLGGSSPAHHVIGASLFSPYHLMMFAVCGVIVWLAPQTWNYTQRLTMPKAGVCLSLLAASVILMWTQAVNPFLYFQF